MTDRNRVTEDLHPYLFDFAERASLDGVRALIEGQAAAMDALDKAASAIATAADAAADRLRTGNGRIVYVGAGTSGRLAVLDGVELKPTFGWPDERVAYLFAGGEDGLRVAQEGAEDDWPEAARAISDLDLTAQDIVIGVAASGGTPYTCEALRVARETGALTIGLANVPDARLLELVEIAVLLETGPEVLAGSTRLAAGTAQKMTLNVLSTAIMARLGKVHDGFMVDMKTSNEKLKTRAVAMVKAISKASESAAIDALEVSEWHVKTAVLVAKGTTPAQAKKSLEAAKGRLSSALQALGESLSNGID